MKLNDIIKWTGGKVKSTNFKNLKIKSITTDSRTIKDGDLFIALKGLKYDGHDYIDDELLKKASAVIVENDLSFNTKTPIIKVESTYKALEDIGINMRNKYNIPLIAITGSVGKTMTKELIYDILSAKYNVLKSSGNRNNHIGLPLTLSELNSKYEIIVTELGMNHVGEIKKLSSICKPDVALLTNIGTSHIGFLGSKKNIFKAKCEIFSEMKNKNIVVNGDDKFLRKIKSPENKIYFVGSSKINNLIANDIVGDLNKTAFTIQVGEYIYPVVLNIPGIHLVHNVLLAIQIGIIFGIDIETIIEAIYKFKSVDKRMEIITKENYTIINDCYNSSYESLMGVIELIENINKPKLLILGDILELGKYSKSIHKKIGRKIKKIQNTKILLVGSEMSINEEIGEHFKNNEDLITYLKNLNIDNHIILVKGSRGMKLEEVVKFLLK